MSITTHRDWPKLKPYFHAQPDMNTSLRRPRVRIEVRETPNGFWPTFVAMPCVHCGSTIYPIRERVTGGLYYAATCPLNENVACSRSSEARAEYRLLRSILPASVVARGVA